LFVPWIYQRHQTRSTAGTDVPKRARGDEIKLIEALVAGGERDGVIGIEKRSELQRLASSIYWAGLGIWRVRRFTGSQDQYHRSWDSLLRRSRTAALDDDNEPLDSRGVWTWDPELPEPPPNLLTNTTLALSRREAEYLQQRVLGLGQSLLGHLVSHTKAARESEFVWSHPEQDGFPPALAAYVEQARLFSEAMHGAALLYNLMLSEERGDEDLRSDYRARYASWATLMVSRAGAFRSWRRESFWALVEGTRTGVGIHSRRFVDDWLKLALGTKTPNTLAEAPEVRALIADRELVLKRGRARLGNPRALERWNGSAGAQQLNFRWHRVRTIVSDMLQGLET
jgi:hypothetical protein